MTGKRGAPVGDCTRCHATVHESYVARRLGRRDGRDVVFLIHTAIKRLSATDPGKPCGGGVKPYPVPAQQHSIDAWRPGT